MNKASGGDGIPDELLLILKDAAIKVLHSVCQQIWKTQQWPLDWKTSVFIPVPKKGNAKECSNYHTTALISDASKVMLKILQARFQQYMNQEFTDVQAAFRKGRGNRDQITNMHCCCYCWVASVVSDSMWPRRRQPTRLPHPWDSPGKNTGVGCHFLLQYQHALDHS